MTYVTRFVAILITIASSSALARPTAVVSLQVNPDHLLLGISPMLKATVTNTGSEPLQLNGLARMTAVDPAGQSFLAIGHQEVPNIDVFARDDDPSLAIPPGVTREFFMRTGLGHGRPLFFGDPRFRTPGRFLLRLELLTYTPGLSFVSNDAAFSVDDPQGVDASVWAVIVASGGLRDTGVPIAAVGEKVVGTVLSCYGSSRYAPFLIPFYQTTDDNLRERLFKMALQQPIPEGFAAEIQLLLLGQYRTLTFDNLANYNLPQALAYLSKTSQLGAQLKNSSLPFVATDAGAIVDNLPTPDQLRARFDDRVKRVETGTAPISPFVQCVDPGTSERDDLFVIFGYDNPNPTGKYIPAGDRNRLHPVESQGNLPFDFAPGHRLNAVTTTAKHDAKVTWTVDGASARASAKTATRCPAPSAPVPVVPLLDCVSANGDSLTATFGYNSPNTVPIRIPVGPDNGTTAGTPPTIFMPGEHRGVLTVHGTDRKTLPAWTIQGTTVTASPSALACSSGGNDD